MVVAVAVLALAVAAFTWHRRLVYIHVTCRYVPSVVVTAHLPLPHLMRRLLKILLRLLTGFGEIERTIMTSPADDASLMPLRVAFSVCLSSTLHDALLQQCMRRPATVGHMHLSARSVVTEIFKLKHLATTTSPIARGVALVMDAVKCLHGVAQLQSRRVSSALDLQPLECQVLDGLWNHLGNEPRSALITKQWQQLGFQGSDPTTDFRSTGMLSLYCLWFACRHSRPLSTVSLARQLFNDARRSDGDAFYFFAIVAIRTVHMLVSVLTSDVACGVMVLVLMREVPSRCLGERWATVPLDDPPRASLSPVVDDDPLETMFYPLFCRVLELVHLSWTASCHHRLSTPLVPGRLVFVLADGPLGLVPQPQRIMWFDRFAAWFEQRLVQRLRLYVDRGPGNDGEDFFI